MNRKYIRGKLKMTAVLGKEENNRVEFTFEISSKDFNKAVNKVYLANRQYFNVPGFRKGKAPRQIIEMNYGAEIFFEDAVNEILPEAYEAAIEELNIKPVSQPEIDIEDIEKGKDILVKAEVDVEPEVKLGDYKALEIEKIEYQVSEEDVEEKLKSVQDMNGRLVDAGDREVKDGDLLTIDYSGFVGGEAFEGGTAEKQQLEIGSNQFIPGFEEQLVGKGIGEEFEIQVTFPEDYHEESLSGEEATFKVTIHDIKEKELPKLDDEFAKDVSEFDTLEEYKESLRAKLEEEMKEKQEAEQERVLIEAVVEIADVDIPESMIETQISNEINEFSQRMSMQGLGLDQYFQLTGTSQSDLEEELRPVATERVRGDLVLGAIAEAEGIEVTEEDRIKELKEMAEMYQQDDVDGFVEEMKNNDLSFLDKALINQKVIELLKDSVKIK